MVLLNRHASFSRRWAASVLCCILFFPGVRGATGGAASTREYDVKATFIFNFTRFVQWPESVMPSPDQPIVIGIIGLDPFAGALDAIIAGEKVNGRPLIVKRFTRKEDFGACQLIYISQSEAGHLAEILERIKGKSVLTVSDIDRFAISGGTIGLVTENGKVRLEINVDRAKAAQITLSAKLLRPALVIHDHVRNPASSPPLQSPLVARSFIPARFRVCLVSL